MEIGYLLVHLTARKIVEVMAVELRVLCISAAVLTWVLTTKTTLLALRIQHAPCSYSFFYYFFIRSLSYNVVDGFGGI